jgi:hypothetical protein
MSANVPLVGDGRAKKRQFFGKSQIFQVQNHFHLNLIPDYCLLAVAISYFPQFLFRYDQSLPLHSCFRDLILLIFDNFLLII